MKYLAGIIGGLILAVLGAILVQVATIVSTDFSAHLTLTTFAMVWIASLVIAGTSTSAGKAWRRMLITASVFSFLLPISGAVLAGSALHVSGAGGFAAGGIMTAMLGFVGLFLGAVFLIIGLLVGKDKQPQQNSYF